MEIAFLVVLILVVTGVAAAVVARRVPPGGSSDLDPPKAPPRTKPSRTKLPRPRRPIPSEAELDRQAAEVVAEAEALLDAARRRGELPTGEEAEPPAPEVSVPEAPEAPEAPGVEGAKAEVPEVPEPDAAPEEEAEELGPRPRFRDRLGKARGLLSGYLGSVRSREKIDETTWDELEEALVRADVGIGATTALLDQLRSRVRSDGIATPNDLVDALKDDLKESLTVAGRELRFEPGATNVWLFVGVNGVGKTTTIGKVGYQQVAEGRSVIMAAGDTFRAAAAEQLEQWSKRAGAQLVRGAEGGDPGSVVFDAVERAVARDAQLVLADTAGRLHTKVNLMEELKKVRRVAEKSAGTVSEVLLVIDATTGQNGLVQARQFAEAVEVTGVVLTKLDGTAKGGIAVAIQNDLGIPIKLVGLGESASDLVAFDPDEFVDALF